MRPSILASFVAATMLLHETAATVTSATASTDDGNVASNVLDGKLGTRWSAKGVDNWIVLTMDQAYDVLGVSIAFFKGNVRAADFKIDVSTDRVTWQSALARTDASGTTILTEWFRFPLSMNCRYIRYTGYGNSANDWNSITVFEVVKGSSATEELIGAVISLRKTGGDRLYLTAESSGDNNIVASASTVGTSEQFLVEEHPLGGVALRSQSTGTYVQVVRDAEDTAIRAQGKRMLTWEQFFVVTAGSYRIALQSGFTGKWWQASHREASATVYPRGPKANSWEAFEWDYVTPPPAAPLPSLMLASGYTLVTSYSQLMIAFATSNGKFRIRPGYYTATELLEDSVTIMRTTASNSIYDFTGATIDLPVKLLSTMRGTVHTFASWKMEGNGNTFIGGTFVNTYADSAMNYKVTDFNAYNADTTNRPGGGNQYLRIWGDDSKFLRNSFVVRGSFPYGYGDLYGKGSGSYFGLRKHSGILIVGDRTLVDGVHLYQKAFGHALFVQGATGTVIRNSRIIGEQRLGLDMYEDGTGSLPDQSGYVIKFPDYSLDDPIPKNRMYCLNEDGIRAYSSGTKLDGTTASTRDITIETTSVTHLRSGLAFVFANSAATVTGLHLRGCSAGYQLPRAAGGTITDSTTDAAFGNVIAIPYSNTRNGVYDFTLVDAAYNTGDHFLTHIGGYNNDITIRTDGVTPTVSRTIKVGYTGPGVDEADQASQYGTSGIDITNYTPNTLELTEFSSGCTGSSAGRIVDYGTGNSVRSM